MNFKEYIQMRGCDETLCFSFVMCVWAKSQALALTHTYKVLLCLKFSAVLTVWLLVVAGHLAHKTECLELQGCRPCTECEHENYHNASVRTKSKGHI